MTVRLSAGFVAAALAVASCSKGPAATDAFVAPAEARSAAIAAAPQPVPAPPAEAGASPPAERPDPSILGHELLGDWVPADTARSYAADDLHLLVDGGDAVYLRYGVRWAVRRSYRTARTTSQIVRVELFAFGDAAGAAGRYRHEALEAGDSWVAKPMPSSLEGTVDSARLDMDQLRFTRGRFLGIVRFEDDAEADPGKLVAEAQMPLEAFAGALARRIDAEASR